MDAKTLSSTIAKFSSKFCNELEKNKSVVCSPLSVEYTLALLTLGTTGPAHSELLTSLGIPDDESIRSSFSSLSTNLRSVEGVTLNVANKVYIKDGDYDLEPKLKEDAVNVFDADIEKVNFTNAAAAAEIINKWVESKTNEKIKDLLSSDRLNQDTCLILVNALYFKGTWWRKFHPKNTKDRPFHVNTATTIQVPMMYKKGEYRYGENQQLKAQLLELPYEANDVKMLIVLPYEIDGLSGVLAKLSDEYDLLSEVDKMLPTKVKISIPKFKIESEIDLDKLLPKLGIKSIFKNQNSGLTKILNYEEPLHVSKAVQRAFIEVNEEGAEAAAVTVPPEIPCCIRRDRNPVKEFRADRPFLTAIFVVGAPFFLATYCGD